MYKLYIAVLKTVNFFTLGAKVEDWTEDAACAVLEVKTCVGVACATDVSTPSGAWSAASVLSRIVRQGRRVDDTGHIPKTDPPHSTFTSQIAGNKPHVTRDVTNGTNSYCK